MKLLKKVTSALLVFIFAITLNSCSGCDNQNPSARVINNGIDDVSVQIKTSGGNTENINNIEPGMSSNSVSYAAGVIEYTIVLKDKTEVVETVTMAFCRTYKISIDENNTITTTSSVVD
ncbi:hypothetical protein H0I31_11765 [Tenacibaculum sp. AHE15PA]|uniref:hypothetical protein n=1 Tax=unclassified Tenacibaculum TaxID=2635139 RepID=UPI001C4ED5CA|nr:MULTISPECIES: hypothetical protein [unclassified Tenacibaculum]QXP73787.1 hypothetical protein H0I30_01215 [Tenacibaculum sp. AHE14PA]QXP75846.1 hypothetical protein H0I31_11765 [Tenacibaculum sp. AHE15PA]